MKSIARYKWLARHNSSNAAFLPNNVLFYLPTYVMGTEITEPNSREIWLC